VEGRFDGGEVSSDGGLILMREADRRLGLIKSVARRLGDATPEGKGAARGGDFVRQRVMALCAGWEDLNDAEELASDPVHQLASGADTLGSAPTLSRFENAQRPGERVGRERGVGGAVHPLEEEGARLPGPGL
jgi:hypothetical protein